MALQRRVLWALLMVAVAIVLVLVFRQPALPVELATVDRGPLVVTVDEEGETRVRDRFVVAAPTAGRVARIALDPGDTVQAGDVVAEISPAPLDRRTRAAAEARIEAAGANREAAHAGVVRARAALAQAERDARRMERLHGAGTAAEEQLERARLEQTTRQQELATARSAHSAAQHELEEARASLLAAEGGDGAERKTCEAGTSCIEIRSPVPGRVLRVLEESERVVTPGTPLLEIGDPTSLEIVVDVLSPDAVRIRPGARMHLARWGGGRPLAAHVRRVEPSGFTKISTLGVEEQRVNVIGDLDEVPEGLGDGFRVEAQIVVHESADVIRVPTSALFRHAEGVAVFVVEDGRARRRSIALGERGSSLAEVRSGLIPGDRVIVHPSDQVDDGVRVRDEGEG